MMRSLALACLAVGACTSAPPAGEPVFDSVRDRLAKPTRMFIGPDGSTGSITAERYTHDGWERGTTPLVITTGELFAKADGLGNVSVSDFAVGVDAIALPDAVFGKPARLENVRLSALSTSMAKAAWIGDDDATVHLAFDLELSWQIWIDGTIASLGPQHLESIDADVLLTGGGDHVDAKVTLAATGDLWSWAGLMKLTAIDLSLAAETLD